MCQRYPYATIVKIAIGVLRMGILSQAATAFFIGFTGAMIPGPMTSVAVHHSVGLGWIAGPMVVSGHAILELCMVAAIALGAAQFLTTPLFTGLVGLIGGLVLVYLGVGVVRHADETQLEGIGQAAVVDRPSRTAHSLFAAVAAGVTTSLSNPFWPIWWGSVGAGHVALALAASGMAGVVAFFIGHIAADLTWFTALTAAVVTGGRRVSPRAVRVTLKLLGVFMLVMAVYFIVSGIRFLTAGTSSTL